jgi:hypothetical protein
MLPGNMAVIMDEHVGVGDDMSSYVLHPGDSGLVIAVDKEIVSLLITGHIIYVGRESVETLED